MNSTLDEVINELLLLKPLIRLADEELSNFIEESGVAPYFAVSWVLTWYFDLFLV